MDGLGLHPGHPITGTTQIGGGTQNVMLRFTRGTRTFVLRRGPQHLRRSSNENLRREIRLTTALAGTDVPHPRLIAACDDESVMNGAVFYLMEPVDGFNAALHLPPLHSSSASARYQMGLSMIDTLAVLARVDYQQVGLQDSGRPHGFLDRQVPRWLGELQSYSDLPNYRDQHLPTDAVATWLTRNQPSSSRPGIMHGDYHVANVMFAHDRPDVAAIVDWEMCTVGDPLLDLGWILATWPDPGDAEDLVGSALARSGGLPTRTALIERYRHRTGFDVTAADWYTVLACFKLGIILEGTYARSCANQAPPDVGRRLHQTAIALFDRACNLIALN
ncbi:phosphotransferase family protein [Mycolicibacterium porcinum]|uniref:phosphotransferase family protein n=1 Tax=Mycolicibacterium porcinum TaxID=39693 RepID=UPI001196CE84|nr:phosphotransferase family protein [Mycolicibacterium porcinum]TVX98964.1 phosphotransferase family protein [Mycolicibacterium porcinum]